MIVNNNDNQLYFRLINFVNLVSCFQKFIYHNTIFKNLILFQYVRQAICEQFGSLQLLKL